MKTTREGKLSSKWELQTLNSVPNTWATRNRELLRPQILALKAATAAVTKAIWETSADALHISSVFYTTAFPWLLVASFCPVGIQANIMNKQQSLYK